MCSSAMERSTRSACSKHTSPGASSGTNGRYYDGSGDVGCGPDRAGVCLGRGADCEAPAMKALAVVLLLAGSASASTLMADTRYFAQALQSYPNGTCWYYVKDYAPALPCGWTRQKICI